MTKLKNASSLGIVMNLKGTYRLFNPKTNRLIISRDVIFDEKICWNWNEDEQVQVPFMMGPSHSSTSMEELLNPPTSSMEMSPSSQSSGASSSAHLRTVLLLER